MHRRSINQVLVERTRFKSDAAKGHKMSHLYRANPFRCPSTSSRTGQISIHCKNGRAEQHMICDAEWERSKWMPNAIPLSVEDVCVCLSHQSDPDVHLSAVMFRRNYSFKESISVAHRNSVYGDVHHQAEGKRQRNGKAGERIYMKLSSIHHHIWYIAFVIHISDGKTSLSQIKDGIAHLSFHGRDSVDLIDKIWSFELNRLTGHAAFIVLLSHESSNWHYRSLGIPCTGHTLDSILKNPTNLMCFRHESSAVSLQRRVHIRVLQGTGLAAKQHSSILKTRFTHPYFVVTFMGKKIRSLRKRRTLAPKWNTELMFDLGNLSGTMISWAKF